MRILILGGTGMFGHKLLLPSIELNAVFPQRLARLSIRECPLTKIHIFDHLAINILVNT